MKSNAFIASFPKKYIPVTVFLCSILIILIGMLYWQRYTYASELNSFNHKIKILHALEIQLREFPYALEAVHGKENQTQATQDYSNKINELINEWKNNDFVNEQNQQAWGKIQEIWAIYQELVSRNQINELKKISLERETDVTPHLQTLSVLLSREMQSGISSMNTIALYSILFLLLVVIIFVYFFVRRFHVDDQKLTHENLEINDILNNLPEGLFLLDKEFLIGSQQSEQLKTLLPNIVDYHGLSFFDFVKKIVIDKKKQSAVKMFINQLYNPRVIENLIHSLNPLNRVEVTNVEGAGQRKNRILSFHFTRVLKGEEISNILVSVKDITAEVRAEARFEREQEQNDLQIEMISKLLNSDESIMRSFLHTSLKKLSEINQVLKNPDSDTQSLHQKIRSISQHIHAFKGESSVLELKAFIAAAESFEDVLQELSSLAQPSGRDFLPLVSHLDSLIEKVVQAEELHRKITGRLNNPLPAPTAATVTDLATVLGRFVVNMGHRHNKSVIMETGGLEHINQESHRFPMIKDIIIQILRNAVVHGIEPVRARTLNGKPTEGVIKLNVLHNPNSDQLRITIEDDGRGIDLEAVRHQAVKGGIATEEEIMRWDNNQLFALIFRPHFSTLPESNSDAGRGIGMDLVRTNVMQLKGNISLKTQAGQFTRFIITLPREE